MNAPEILDFLFKEKVMKNLKKVLVLVALLAMIVSSVAVIALAEAGQYTGNLADAQNKLAAVDAKESIDEKSAALISVYQYFTANPLDPSQAGYDDFVRAYNAKSLEILVGLSDGRFDALDDGTYYSYSLALEAIKAFESVPNINYSPITSELYIGDVAVVAAKLETVEPTATYEALLATMAEIYIYLVNKPVNPTTDAYFNFIVDYNEAADLLAEKIGEAISSALTTDAKIDIMVSVRRTLAGVADDLGTEANEYVAPAPISASVVAAFNSLREAMAEEYEYIEAAVEEITPLEAISSPTLVTDLAEFETLLAALEEEAERATVEIASFNSCAKAAAEYLAKNDIDPAASGYTEKITRYNDAINANSAYYESLIDSQSVMDERVQTLSDWYDAQKEFPYSESAVSRYNAAHDELVDECRNLIGTLEAYEMPVYVAPEAERFNATVESLNYVLDDVKAAYNKYASAEEESKAAALDEMKSAMADMYKYLTVAVIDTSAEGYLEFKNDYDAAKVNFVSAMLETVDAAEAENKESALAAVKDFFNENPLSKSVIDAYNSKVDELFATDSDKAAEFKLVCIYHNTDTIIEEIESSNDRDSKYAAFKLLYSYYCKKHDVTDSAYGEFVEKYNDVAQSVEEVVISSFVTKEIAERQEAVATAHSLLTAAPFSQAAVDSLKNSAAAYASEINSNLAELDGEAPTAPLLVNEYVTLSDLMKNYYDAEGIENQRDAFKELYDKVAALDGTYIKSTDASYAEFYASYCEICNSFATLFMADFEEKISKAPIQQLQALQDANEYLASVRFSQTVVAFYNAKLELTKESDFVADSERMQSSAPQLDYSATESLNADLTDVKTLIGALSSGDDLENAYKAAYEHIVAAEKAYDFANAEYLEVIVDFNSAKTEIKDNNFDSVKDADINGKKDALQHFYDYINSLSGTSSSVGMVDAYNSARAEAYSGLLKSANAEFEIYKARLQTIENHYANCPIDRAQLSDTDKTVYDRLMTNFVDKLDAMRYTLISGYVVSFETANGALAVIRQNYVIDQLKHFDTKYSLNPQYNENAFSKVIYKEAFELILDKIAALTDETEKANEIENMKSYLAASSFPQSLVDAFKSRFEITEDIQTQQYEGVVAQGKMGELGLLVCDFYEAASLADMKTAFAAVIDYVNANPLSETSNVNEKKTEIVSSLKKITEEQKKVADSTAPLSDYDYGYFTHLGTVPIDFDFEKSKTIYPTNWSTKNYVKKVATDADGNSYVEVMDNASGAARADYTPMSFVNTGGSFVFEMDIMSDEDFDFEIMFIGKGEKVSGNLVTVAALFEDNRLCYASEYERDPEEEKEDYPNYEKGVDDPIYLVPGQWMHITCVIDVENQEQELLIDHVSLGRRPLKARNGTNKKDDSTCVYYQIWFQEKVADKTVFCYDNYKIYSGSAYRIVDRFEKSNEVDNFKLFVDCLTNEENSMVDRMYAYNEAKALVSKVASLAPESYVQRFIEFDYEEELFNPAQGIYLSRLEEMVSKLKKEKIDSKNIAEKQTDLDALTGYLNINLRYINQTTERYLSVKKDIDYLQSSAVRINNLANLIEALSLFDRATTSTAMQKHADNAKICYELCNLENSEYYEAAMDDPATKAFFEKITDERYKSLEAYYYDYIPSCIDAQIKRENSQKIIDCVGFIETVASGKGTLSQAEYHAALKTAALQNVDFVNTYVVVIRAIITSGNYDTEYAGVSEALIIYDLLNETFYDLLMEEHYKVIKEQLDKYSLTESYIGRAGICKYVENYIELNNVDMESETGKYYSYLLEVHKAELDIYKDDFIEVLEANTKAFIATVNKMTAYVTYKELKPLYDEAIQKYYYNMNVDAPETQTAIALFETYEAKLKKIEEDSAMFVGYAKTLATASKKAQVYRALVNCGMYVDGVDESVEGVSSALSTYEKKLAAYNEQIAAVNGDVSNAIDVACSVRSNSIAATVLAVVKSLFSK